MNPAGRAPAGAAPAGASRRGLQAGVVRPVVQPKMVMQRHPFGGAAASSALTGGRVIQPYGHATQPHGHVIQPYGDVIQCIDWDYWKNYAYNALGSVQSLGSIATGIAAAVQATGWAWAAPALIAAVPGWTKRIWNELFDGGDINYSDETKKKIGIKLATLAMDTVSTFLPIILTGIALPSASVAVGSITAIIAAVSWVIVASFTDNYESWEKMLFKYVKEKIAACCQRGEQAPLLQGV